MKCYEGRLGFMGAYFDVRVETRGVDTCGDLRRLIEHVRSPDEALNIVERILEEHGGCVLVSKDPLIVQTGDCSVRLVAQPASMLASMLYKRLVRMVEERCRSAKDAALTGA
ncbi:hypothetical protein Pyrfu_1979 [Pyrolobus fumarii 1A]|uniref:Uncharacterized protein n=1 Tax=Pyrolobus fumarii (strain DSM 11204 / 1A) TaxID=694429 RepID=G0EDM8_PYRF1|nr:hypothetical protein [Pyrolobus fumarii]AEM39832.1 hypothetical protein Pyrfu_1979 [Pyrolobus fumarii 1A]